MRVLFALTIALFSSLVSPAFCQPPNGPNIFPDKHTRKLARELDLKLVKKVFIRAEKDTKVTDPKAIALLVEGLKTANTTIFSNKVDYLEVTGKDGRALIEYRFSASNLPELSPELVEGLKAAGAAPRSWKESEDAEKWQRKIQRNLLLSTVCLFLMISLVFCFAKWIYRNKR